MSKHASKSNIGHSSETASLSPNLKNIFEKESLKWIFVGGKGGVGKTTCSSSIAIQLAQSRETVLIISTDPAHNLSDAFNQKFSWSPTKVAGFENLYAMEINANESFVASLGNTEMDSIIKEILSALPGVDEAMGYIHVVRLVEDMNFSAIVFDTAPTGHTIRLLNFPLLLEKFFERATNLKRRFGPMFDHISVICGFTRSDGVSPFTNQRFNELLTAMRQANVKFKDPEHTTFVCVCLAEFLSVYETERLVQELVKLGIHTDNMIVNQLLLDSASPDSKCNFCENLKTTQRKYLEQIVDLYDDFHIIKLPLLTKEIRGVEELTSFSKYLIEPYTKQPSK